MHQTMQNLTIHPLTHPLRGTRRVPGDKSISHRALILGALAEGTSDVVGWLPAADCYATLHVMRALGVPIEHDPATPTRVRVHGVGLHGLREPENVLDCDGSGTTMRLLCGLLAGQSFFSVLTGRDALRRRPMRRIADPLRRMGAAIDGRDGGNLAPLAIRGAPLRAITYEMPIASAQVKSALMLAGLYAEGETVITQPGPARDHTERMLHAMGAPLTLEANTVRVQAPQAPLRPLTAPDGGAFVVPADISSAAFLIVAALLVPNSTLRLVDVGINPTRTGILDILQRMGATWALDNVREDAIEPTADLIVHHQPLHGTTIAGDLVVRAIDEFPIIAVAATQAEGETIVRDAAELRVKETDRIGNVARELRKMGADIEPLDDGFVVRGPTPLRGATVESHGDHRLAMALTVAALIADGPTTLQGADVMADSFPRFVETLLGEVEETQA